jgi:hypothetical protein
VIVFGDVKSAIARMLPPTAASATKTLVIVPQAAVGVGKAIVAVFDFVPPDAVGKFAVLLVTGTLAYPPEERLGHRAALVRRALREPEIEGRG